jgi:hypothetical protein
MRKPFYVILTLDYLSGASSKQVVDILEAIEMDRALKEGGKLPKRDDPITDLSYSALKELPDANS